MYSSAKRSVQQLPSFDDLVKLVQEDEAAFEQLKREKCQELIDSSSLDMQPRLQAQQSHIDRLVGHCKNPHHVNVVLSQELQKQVVKFQTILQGNSEYEEAKNAANQDMLNVISISRPPPN
ncbi:DUF3135 domain-containing protein [Vibrio scophthalmi]|uniref:Uncharacterized protein n=1 Tax=Vibrio scophthalmi LMG 19158 TaxID=870967 RepID=F9RKG3_9VIBR|nr:DUF3135 domain-containing protein [Vibrio scophthalmi]EGU39792.1 hypothetical protein VIS19158_15721 [Vibrio scophthalmi LMG 19158]